MLDHNDIVLRYHKTLRREHQWFLLYEFDINDSIAFQRSDLEIITLLLKSKALGEPIYHSEMDNSEIELSREGLKYLGRPYDFDLLSTKDFCYLKDLNEFKNWVNVFRMEGWRDDREDAQILITRAEKEIFKRTKIKNGIWHLSKAKIKENSKKLTELHWIYLHFETFIEIDRENQMIRTFDFGYD